MGLRLSPAARYVLLRVAFIPVAGYVVMTLAFFLVNLVPADPARVVLGQGATPQNVAEFDRENGLDGSVFVRYGHYVAHLFSGDLGTSYYDHSSILTDISSKITSTLELVLLGLVVAWLVGTLLGGLAAVYRGRILDTVLGAIVGLLQSVPDFVIGLLGVLVLAYAFRLLPITTGQLPAGVIPANPVTGAALVDAVIAGDWGIAWQATQQLVIPVLALGLFNSVIFARTVRTTLAQALDAGYSEFGIARGLPHRTVVRLALRASIIPTVTYAGISFAGLVGGDAIVETVFSWGGLGQWGITAVSQSDLPAAEGFVLVAGLISVAAYLCSDLLVFALDPRIRRPGGGGGRR